MCNLSQGMLERGVVQGRQEESKAILKDALLEKGILTAEVEDIIAGQTNLDILRQWIKLAVKAESIEEWREEITRLL